MLLFLLGAMGMLHSDLPVGSAPRPDGAAREREGEMAGILQAEFPAGVGETSDPLLGFVSRLSQRRERSAKALSDVAIPASRFSPRFCYSYFALYGDPLLEKKADPY